MNKDNRHRATTVRVATPFGSLYVHVAYDREGCAIEVSISSPGKFSDTEMGEVLAALSTAITEVLRDVPLIKRKEED